MNANTVSLKDADLIAVSPEEFIPGTTVPADVFLKLSDEKYILIARKGTKAAFNELHAAEKEEIEKLYVKKSDYKDCVGQNLTVAGVIIQKNEIPDQIKADFLSKTTDIVFKEIQNLGFNHETLEHAKNVSHSIQKLVEAKKDISSVLNLMNGISNDLMKHSLAVSILSVVIAKSMNFMFPQTLEKLALGGLLHDVGMKEFTKEFIEKPRHLMTPDEISYFETHVMRGAEVLRSMPSIPDDLVAIVLEHHENSVGQGYPRRLRDFKTNPLAKIVALADKFSEITLSSASNPIVKSPTEAINYIEVTLGQPFNKPAFLALKNSLDQNLSQNSMGKIKLVA
jgi:putative nucleotidyltransferase with HDIG domain